MYPQATERSSGDFDSRMSASTVPSPNPTTAAAAVSRIVPHRPSSTDGQVRYCQTMLHSHLGLETSELTTIASSTATIAVATQRAGWRAP